MYRDQGLGFRVLEPKYYNIKGIWNLKTHYLDPWTRRVRVYFMTGLYRDNGKESGNYYSGLYRGYRI